MQITEKLVEDLLRSIEALENRLGVDVDNVQSGHSNDKDELATTLLHIKQSNESNGITSNLNNQSSTNNLISNGLDQAPTAARSGCIGNVNITGRIIESNNNQANSIIGPYLTGFTLGIIGAGLAGVVGRWVYVSQKKVNHADPASLLLIGRTSSEEEPSDHCSNQLVQHVSSFGNTDHLRQTSITEFNGHSDSFAHLSNVVQTTL